jgi:dTDP-4-amino-4,6-dideoxygalactose transaminase
MAPFYHMTAELTRPIRYRQRSLRAAAEVLSLPVFPEMTTAEQDLVVNRLSEAISATQRKAA